MNTSRLAVLAVAFGLCGCTPVAKPIEPYTAVSTTPSDTAA